MFDPNAPWLDDTVVAPAAAEPGFTDVIPGAPPKPPAPKDRYAPLDKTDPRYRPDFPNAQVDQTTNQVDYGPQVKVADSDEAKKQAAIDAARNTVASIERARPLVSNWSTGLGGAVGKVYPGSDQAKQLDAIIHQELRGNIFQNWVAQLKAESTTGTSGIGRIMQSEIPLVTGALGALDPVALGKDGTLQSFDQIEQRIIGTAARLNGENPDDPAVIDKYKKEFGAQYTTPSDKTPPPAPGAGPSGGGGSGGDAGPLPPGASDLTPEQQAKDQAFLKTNPTPDQYAAFLGTLTGGPVDAGAAAKRLKAAQAGGIYSGTVINPTEQKAVADRIAEENKLGLTESPAETLLKQGATLNLSDEAAGVGNAAANLLTHPLSFDPVGSYQLGRDVERQHIADARNALGYAAAPIEFAGGLASGSPTNALAALSDVPALVRQGATAGAAGGALAGFGAGQGAQQSIAGAGVGFAVGAGVGAAAPAIASRFTNSNALASLAPDAVDVAKAGQKEGVNVLRPMVDPGATSRFNALRDKPFSGPIIDAGVNKTTGQIASRVSDLGKGGTALEPQAMGDAAKATGLRYITDSGQHFNRLYGQIRQGIGDTKLPASALGQQIDGLISDLSETPGTNAKEIAWLKALKSDYASKDMSVDALRGLRTKIRQQLAKGDLTFGPDEARVSSLADAASQDITNGLRAAGKGDLADRFREVDSAYRDRMDMIQGTVQKLIGKRGQNLSGEQVYQNLKTMAGPRGSASGVTRLREQMTPEEANDMAATFAESLGKDTKGNFTASDLVKQTDPRKMPLAMRKALFGDDGAASIENLRTLAKKLNDTTSGPASPYRAPWRQAARAFLSNITRLGPLAVGTGVGAETHSIGAGVTAATVSGGVAGVGAARNVLSARAMVNPRVTKWLVNAADVSTPSQAKQAVKGLSLVISREPALAHELTPIRDFLDQRVTQLLAANPNDQKQSGQPTAPQPLAPGQYDASTFGNRPDGTAKGTGFLGVMKRPDGNVSTEISVGLPINGKEMDVPTMVPGLTPQEINWLLTTPVDRVARELPDSIRQKAVAHAKARLAAGLSPFKQPNEN